MTLCSRGRGRVRRRGIKSNWDWALLCCTRVQLTQKLAYRSWDLTWDLIVASARVNIDKFCIETTIHPVFCHMFILWMSPIVLHNGIMLYYVWMWDSSLVSRCSLMLVNRLMLTLNVLIEAHYTSRGLLVSQQLSDTQSALTKVWELHNQLNRAPVLIHNKTKLDYDRNEGSEPMCFSSLRTGEWTSI